MAGIVGGLDFCCWSIFAHHDEFAMDRYLGLDICDILGDLAIAIHRDLRCEITAGIVVILYSFSMKTRNLPFLFIILSLLAVACGPGQPKLEQKKMVSVLCDVMVMEAGHQVKYNYGILPDSIWVRDYGFVCKKHGVKYDDFKAELLRLKANPAEFDAVMEKVITQLQLAEMNARKGNQ